jgi:multiple sugar transport system ATP-binding protein
MMSTLRLDDVSKDFGDRQAVSGLRLECRDGEFLVLLGRSGAGKSTTLRLVAGIESPTQGEVLFDGQRVTALAPEQRDVAMAFESYALYPHRTVREHLEFPLRAPGRKLSEGAIQERVKQVAELLEIGGLLARRPTQLSGGQRQRVSLGRALVRRARITLLDEPVAHLDARLRHDLRGELKRHQQAQGATSIYATPDFSEAAAIADRIAVLVDGRLRQVDTPAHIYDHPADVDVALMAGDLKMNLFDAASVAQLAQPVRGTHRLGVRPSDIRVLDRAEPASMAGTVYVTEPMGYDQIVRVEAAGQVVTARMPLDRGRFEIGQPVWLAPDWRRQHPFDAQGRRLGAPLH